MTYRMDDDLPDDLAGLLSLTDWKDRIAAAAMKAPNLDLRNVQFLAPGKTLCVGLNYLDHVAEIPYPRPEYPVFFRALRRR